MQVVDGLFGSAGMAAVFSGEGQVRGMLAFEAGLARAEARAGVIPTEAAAAIDGACAAARLDVAALYREAELGGSPAIPLVRLLTALTPDGARGYVHWGATSQDAIDTAMMLQAREGLALLRGGLTTAGDACAELAERYRQTPMAGRTLLQQAAPITFGLKAARWLALVTRQVRRLDEVRDACLAVQLGGAVGTLAALGDAGTRVVELLAEELGLPAPELPWHTERDRVVELASAVARVAAAMAKVAGDVVLLAQSEVGEVAEGGAPGKGGSSAMPQKRNPVDAMLALAGARLALGMATVVTGAPGQEHERAAGGWQAEWAALPHLFDYTAGSVERVGRVLTGLVVAPERMHANLDASGGQLLTESLTMALAAHIGRPDAFRLVQSLVERARERGVSIADAARHDEQVGAVLTPEAVAHALDPASYLGSNDAFIDRALAGWRAARPVV